MLYIIAIALIPAFAYISVMVTKPIMLIHLALAVSMIVVCCVVVGAVKKSVKRKADLAKKRAEDEFYTRGKEIEKRIQECNKELKRLKKDESWITSESFEPGFNSKNRDVYSMTDKEIDDFFLWLAYHPNAEKQYENTWFHKYVHRYINNAAWINNKRIEFLEDRREAELSGFGLIAHQYDDVILSGYAKDEVESAEADMENMLNRSGSGLHSRSYKSRATFAVICGLNVVSARRSCFNAGTTNSCTELEKKFQRLLSGYDVKAKTAEEKDFLRIVKIGTNRIYQYNGRLDFSDFNFFKELGI